MNRDRKNGQKQSQPICLWNGILEKKHRDRIGKAIWLYLEMLDKITLEDAQDLGWLLGRKPIKLADFTGNVLTNRRHFRRLIRHGYIVARRTPYGNIIGVTNTRKLRFGRVSSSAQSGMSGSAKSRGVTEQFSVASVSRTAEYKEDNAIDNAVRKEAASSVWKETGVDSYRVPGPFKKLCEELWPARSGTIFDFMGFVLDAWQALGNTKYPPAWVKRKAELRLAASAGQEPELAELEAIPWQK